MELETNLTRIRELARQREDENWEFRAFLKGLDMPRSRVDRLVQGILLEVAASIDCTACGNCCRVLSPVLKPVDVQRLAARLGLTPDELQAQHLKEDPDGEGWAFRAMPCAFLEGSRCSVYAERPGVCRSYPYLHRPGFVSRSIRVLQNYAVCPIVFNVYEALKAELWRSASAPGRERGDWRFRIADCGLRMGEC